MEDGFELVDSKAKESACRKVISMNFFMINPQHPKETKLPLAGCGIFENEDDAG